MSMVSGRIYVRPGTREAFLTRAVRARSRTHGAPGDAATSSSRLTPSKRIRVNVYDAWESEETRIALRGDGPGDDVSSSLVQAEVAKHVVASSEPA